MGPSRGTSKLYSILRRYDRLRKRRKSRRNWSKRGSDSCQLGKRRSYKLLLIRGELNLVLTQRLLRAVNRKLIKDLLRIL